VGRKRVIIIPPNVKCTECGSKNLTGRGTDWRVNPYGDNPKRIKVPCYQCEDCGKIFVDGENKEIGGNV